MDLFTLVAKLTLSTDEYDKAIKHAQNAAKSFSADAEGTISADDQYTEALEAAEDAAADFEGDASGTISGTDKYSAEEQGAQESADDFDGDVDGTIDGTDDYSGEEQSAQASADDFDGDVDGTIDGTDDYTEEAENAQEAADNFDGDIKATITADTEEFTDALEDARNQGGEFEDYFTSVTSNLSGALTAAGIVAGILAIGQAFGEAIDMTAQYTDSVDKGSAAMSMNTTAYQEWDHALSQSGASIDDLSKGYLNLRNAMHSAKTDMEAWGEDTSDLHKALGELGINPANFESAESMLDAVMTRLADYHGPEDRDWLTTAIFGKGGTKLNALLAGGSTGIEDLKQEAHDLGLVLSGSEIANGVAYGDAIANMNAALDSLKMTVIGDILPALTSAVEMVTSLITLFNSHTQKSTVGEQMEEIDDTMADAMVTATENEKVTLGLIDSLYGMSDATGKCNDDLDTWDKLARKIVELCPTLAQYIDMDTHSITAQKEELETLTKAWAENARAQAIHNANAEKAAVLAQTAGDISLKQIEQLEAQERAKATLDTAREEFIKFLQGQGRTEGVSVWGRSISFDEIRNMSAADLRAMMSTEAGMWANSHSWLDSIDSNSEYARAKKAAEESMEMDQKAVEAAKDIASLEEQLAEETKNYETWKKAADDYLKSLQDIVALNGTEVKVTIREEHVTDTDGSHAKGLNYSPYDGYIAELHRGEVILNQGQSRSYMDGGDADPDAIYDAVYNAVIAGMAQVSFEMNGITVADLVTDRVSRNLASQLGRRG